MNHIIEILMYKDGTYDINDLGKVPLATQKLSGDRNGKSCIIYRCLKGQEQKYLKNLAKERLKDIEKQIQHLEEQKLKLSKL